MGMRRWAFEYLYRDGGNFKTYGKLVVSGRTEGAEKAIRDCLDWGDQFVAEQVSVPPLYALHWNSVGEGPSELDHAYHEFVGLAPLESSDEGSPVWGQVEELVERFQKAARRWDVTLSPNCYL